MASFCKVYPDAPVFTSIYEPESTLPFFKQIDIRTSFMQHAPGLKKHFKKYLPFYPQAFQSFDFTAYDVILTSSSAFGKCVSVPQGTCHIVYCHNPMRFVWMYNEYIQRESLSPIFKCLLPPIIKYLKEVDLRSNNNVHYFIANSQNVANRIEKWYQRTSEIIYPPVNLQQYRLNQTTIKDYFLIVSRLREYKRIDVAIQAFNELGLPLKIVGTGSDRKKLERMAKPNIEFLGFQDDDALMELYSQCQALIFPGEEDFGIIPLEAQASGRPVIAYRKGGALETIINEKTGVFFDKQTSSSLREGVQRFQRMSFNETEIHKNALSFDDDIFQYKIKNFVQSKWAEFQSKRPSIR